MFDVFISYASEDKQDIVESLVKGLLNAGLSVWYDDFSLKLGDSLRESIDKGLSDSRYGVVILSPNFFKKGWTRAELGGLFAKSINGESLILPVWHNIGRAEILKWSPMLADKVAAKTAEGIDRVIMKILDVVKPELSHLTIDGQTVSVDPPVIRLGTGGWTVKTPVLILNNSKTLPLYSVGVKITIQTEGVSSEEIDIEYGEKVENFKGSVGPVETLFDIIRLDCIDSEGREAVALFCHTIGPNSSRRFIVSGKHPVEGMAQVKVWTFKTKPAELLQKLNQIALPFPVLPENVRIKKVYLALKRTSY